MLPPAAAAGAAGLRRAAGGGREWVECFASRGCSSMAEQKLPKLTTRVRFPSPAPCPAPARPAATLQGMPRAPRKPPSPPSFAARVVRWQRVHGRHDLPWQGTRDAYRIWLSEIMLQQTQVATVIPYYARFLARFPDVARARRAQPRTRCWRCGAAWATTRARATCTAPRRRSCASIGGEFPAAFDDARDAARHRPLDGGGDRAPSRAASGARSSMATCAACSRAMPASGAMRPAPRRSRGSGREAESRLPRRDIEAYTQGLMDLGADVCLAREPRCLLCPVAPDCVARASRAASASCPAQARARARPRRRIAMLVVLSRGEVLLEKRPAHGHLGRPVVAARGRRGRGAEDGARARLGARRARASRRSRPSSTPSRISRSRSRRGASRRAGRGAAGRRGSAAHVAPLQEVAGAALPAPGEELPADLRSASLLAQELGEDREAQRRVGELEQLLLHVAAQRQDLGEAEAHPARVVEVAAAARSAPRRCPRSTLLQELRALREARRVGAAGSGAKRSTSPTMSPWGVTSVETMRKRSQALGAHLEDAAAAPCRTRRCARGIRPPRAPRARPLPRPRG